MYVRHSVVPSVDQECRIRVTNLFIDSVQGFCFAAGDRGCTSGTSGMG
jgi:hypothetical protein